MAEVEENANPNGNAMAEGSVKSAESTKPEESAKREKFRFSKEQLRSAMITILRMPRVFRLVWKARPALAMGVLALQLILGLLPLANVWVFKLLLDAIPATIRLNHGITNIFAVTMPHQIKVALTIMAFSWFANETMQPMLTFCIDQLNDYLTRDINLLISDKVNNIIDISVLENPKFYDQLQRVQNDLHDKPIMMVVVSAQLGQAAITLISLSVVVTVLSPWLVLLITAFATPKIVLQLKQMYEIWKVLDGDVPEVRRMRYYTNVLTNSQDGKEIRVFGLGDYFRDRFLNTFDQFQTRRTKVRKSHLNWNFGLAALSSTGSIISYTYTVLRAIVSGMSLGTMSLYLGAITQMEGSLAQAAYLVSQLWRNTLFVGRLFDFLEIESAIKAPCKESVRSVPSPIKDGIEFRNVSFSYPGSERKILDGLSFKISKGQTVALVGENGAGKTTVVKLLSRFYDPTAGQILVDGIDLCDCDPREWRAQMAVVFQDYSKFQMSVRENIGIGHLDHIDNTDAIQDAAERGGAAPVVAKLSGGYETMLGKMFEDNAVGTELSGGEWQKIALARAFMRSFKTSDGNGTSGNGKQAQLLILDEPTASLDVQSEYDVYCKFHDLTDERMALLITHRFSTVRIADKILVLENGKLIEEGSHDELISSESSYAKLYNLQADRYR